MCIFTIENVVFGYRTDNYVLKLRSESPPIRYEDYKIVFEAVQIRKTIVDDTYL